MLPPSAAEKVALLVGILGVLGAAFYVQAVPAWLIVVSGVAGGLFGVLAYALRFLDAGGAVAGALLGAALVGLGGWMWIVPAVVFFATSSLLSRMPGKPEAEAVSEKGSRRDVAQVVANGGVGGALLLLAAFVPDGLWYAGFVGAFAAACADTWATEVGTRWGGPPRLVTTGQRVPPGTSGAISGVGTLAAGGGALVVAASAWAIAGGSVVAMLALAASGFIASFVDSLAGATVQARFLDERTGRETERPASEGGPNRYLRGWRRFRNDQVNALGTAAGAALAMACFAALDFAS